MVIWIALATAVLYCIFLFWLAHRGDRGKMPPSMRNLSWVYGLSLAVYCTSWTFYGAVGTATMAGWQFLPIYLGPILLFTLGYRLVDRTLKVGKAQHSTSIADFLSARYGKSASVAALVTIIATVGTLPYMALQLKSVGETLLALSPEFSASQRADDVVLAVAAAMALFAVLFGSSRIDLTQHNRGMVLAIALEAIVKLAALGMTAGFAIWLLVDAPATNLPQTSFGDVFTLQQFDARFAILTLIAACAALCLPRQFHMTIVEAQTDRPTPPMRWIFPVYLAITSLVVIPIVIAGMSTVVGADDAPDMLMLSMPLQFNADALAIFVFIGGFSAATGMIIVTTIALSGMITNDLLIPLFYRSRVKDVSRNMAVGRSLLLIRRLTIITLLGLAYLYYRSIDREETLAGLGTISFAAVAQFAPGLVGGLLWRDGNRHGMIAGLSAGFAVWLFTLFLPGYLDVQPLFKVAEDPLVSGVLLSLSANIIFYILVSMFSNTNLVDRAQAASFMGVHSAEVQPATQRSSKRVADFRLLLFQFIGEERGRAALNAIRLTTARNYHDADPVDDELIAMTERQISGILGSSSARALILSTLEDDPVPIEDVVAMFDETSQRLQFSGELLQTAIENIDQGIALVDRELRLVTWNTRYIEMFNLPADLVTVGRPIAELIAFNLQHTVFSEEQIADHIAKRLDHLRAGRPHSIESEQADGRILRIRGNPTPNGGYVTSYTDITADRLAEKALEAKVEERTKQLMTANAALEQATRSKTRFLAAASHDLVQPMNAARLFTSALADEVGKPDTQVSQLLTNIDKSIGTANRLLRALLDISKLDGGGLKPKLTTFQLGDLLDELESEFRASAEAKGLDFTVMPCSLWVNTDRGLLLSVMQNLTANAIRYTDQGRVLVGCRKHGANVRLHVFDTGPGVAPEQQSKIFEEFYRLKEAKSEDGLGLGLAIVRRIAQLLETKVCLDSTPGSGSNFSITLPCAKSDTCEEKRPEKVRPLDQPLAGHRVLYIDNDQTALDALSAVLARWDMDVRTASGPSDVLGKEGDEVDMPDLIIVDYQLDDGDTGDLLYLQLCERWGGRIPVIMVTAEASEDSASAARNIEAERLLKPVPPATLRALINQILGSRS